MDLSFDAGVALNEPSRRPGSATEIELELLNSSGQSRVVKPVDSSSSEGTAEAAVRMPVQEPSAKPLSERVISNGPNATEIAEKRLTAGERLKAVSAFVARNDVGALAERFAAVCVDEKGGFLINTSDFVGHIARGDASRADNFKSRQSLYTIVCDLFGGEEKIPAAVKTAMKLDADEEDVQGAFCTDTPLSLKRLRLVTEAVKVELQVRESLLPAFDTSVRNQMLRNPHVWELVDGLDEKLDSVAGGGIVDRIRKFLAMAFKNVAMENIDAVAANLLKIRPGTMINLAGKNKLEASYERFLKIQHDDYVLRVGLKQEVDVFLKESKLDGNAEVCRFFKQFEPSAYIPRFLSGGYGEQAAVDSVEVFRLRFLFERAKLIVAACRDSGTDVAAALAKPESSVIRDADALAETVRSVCGSSRGLAHFQAVVGANGEMLAKYREAYVQGFFDELLNDQIKTDDPANFNNRLRSLFMQDKSQYSKTIAKLFGQIDEAKVRVLLDRGFDLFSFYMAVSGRFGCAPSTACSSFYRGVLEEYASLDPMPVAFQTEIVHKCLTYRNLTAADCGIDVKGLGSDAQDLFTWMKTVFPQEAIVAQQAEDKGSTRFMRIFNGIWQNVNHPEAGSPDDVRSQFIATLKTGMDLKFAQSADIGKELSELYTKKLQPHIKELQAAYDEVVGFCRENDLPFGSQESGEFVPLASCFGKRNKGTLMLASVFDSQDAIQQVYERQINRFRSRLKQLKAIRDVVPGMLGGKPTWWHCAKLISSADVDAYSGLGVEKLKIFAEVFDGDSFPKIAEQLEAKATEVLELPKDRRLAGGVHLLEFLSDTLYDTLAKKFVEVTGDAKFGVDNILSTLESALRDVLELAPNARKFMVQVGVIPKGSDMSNLMKAYYEAYPTKKTQRNGCPLIGLALSSIAGSRG